MLLPLTAPASAWAQDAASAAANTSTASTIAWHDCQSADGFDCGSVSVPLNYDVPDGEHIDIAVIRHRATNPAHRVGSLFWNPGGPGGGGTTALPLFYSSFPAQLRARFDIVSFDPRGIGVSAPLTCFDTPGQESALLDQLPAGFPVGAEQEQRAVAVNAQFAAACARHGGAIQFHMSTANVARDMDRLRAAVGDRRLDFYGTSYGTYLGATYANLFPARTGHIVLDGNASPVEWNDNRAGRTENTFDRLASPLGTQLGLHEMLAECGQVGATRCAFSAGTPAATLNKYRRLLGLVSASPVTVSGQQLTYATLVSAVASGLVAQNDNPVTHTGWVDLSELLQAAWTQTTRPDVPTVPLSPPARALALSAGATAPGLLPDSAAPLPEATPGVLCSESPNPRDPHSYAEQARRTNAAQSPDGFAYVWSSVALPCAQWQARDADRYNGPWNRSTAPLLVVGTLADSNTAYLGSQRMAVQLSNTRLLTQTGGGHTALLNRSDCVDRYTTAYLLHSTLPDTGTTCSQNRKPF